jgi:pimeloyl-ACP methyl ester carboxylesterase
MGESERIDVTSLDGTPIAVWIQGQGRPLVMVHGGISDHTNDAAFIAVLGRNLTTYAVDRRGRGGSGDSREYAIEREFEDIAAVVDAVAERARQPVAVWGHSYGADVAMGSATLTANVDKLVLYEPGLGITYPPGSVDAVNSAIASGDLEAATIALFLDVVGLTDEEMEFIRSLPTWPARVRLVPTVPREMTAESSWVYRPDQFRRVAAKTLVLAGSESPAEQAKASRAALNAIPGATLHVLEGHSHIAHRTDPEMAAQVILTFVGNETGAVPHGDRQPRGEPVDEPRYPT